MSNSKVNANSTSGASEPAFDLGQLHGSYQSGLLTLQGLLAEEQNLWVALSSKNLVQSMYLNAIAADKQADASKKAAQEQSQAMKKEAFGEFATAGATTATLGMQAKDSFWKGNDLHAAETKLKQQRELADLAAKTHPVAGAVAVGAPAPARLGVVQGDATAVARKDDLLRTHGNTRFPIPANVDGYAQTAAGKEGEFHHKVTGTGGESLDQRAIENMTPQEHARFREELNKNIRSSSKEVDSLRKTVQLRSQVWSELAQMASQWSKGGATWSQQENIKNKGEEEANNQRAAATAGLTSQTENAAAASFGKAGDAVDRTAQQIREAMAVIARA